MTSVQGPLTLVESFRCLDFHSTGETLDTNLLEHFLTSVEDKFTDEEIEEFRKLPAVDGTKFNYSTYLDLVKEKRVDQVTNPKYESPTRTKQLVVKKRSVPLPHPRESITHQSYKKDNQHAAAAPEIILTSTSPGMIRFGEGKWSLGGEHEAPPMRRVTTELAIMPRHIRRDILSTLPTGETEGLKQGTTKLEAAVVENYATPMTNSNNSLNDVTSADPAERAKRAKLDPRLHPPSNSSLSGSNIQIPGDTGASGKSDGGVKKSSTSFFSLGSFRKGWGGK